MRPLSSASLTFRSFSEKGSPGSIPSFYWNPRGPELGGGTRPGSHSWCTAEPENWESGPGNLSSFSPTSCLRGPACHLLRENCPSGLWKLGRKLTLLAVADRTPPLSFSPAGSAFCSALQARRRPLAPWLASDRAALGSVSQSSPSRRSSGNSTASASPAPEVTTPLRHAPSASGRGDRQPRPNTLQECGLAPGRIRPRPLWSLRSNPPAPPRVPPEGAGAELHSLPRPTTAPKSIPVCLAPGHSGEGAGPWACLLGRVLCVPPALPG